MKGSRYYKNLDFSKPVGTHRYVDNIKDRRQLAKVCLVAMARINQAEQGTITEPYELASSKNSFSSCGFVTNKSSSFNYDEWNSHSGI